MRTTEKIIKNSALTNIVIGKDGGMADIDLYVWTGSIVWSFGGGWDHVSISPYKKRITPSWDDMCKIKDIFFEENETVIQYHPAKSEYINRMANCLHLWRPQTEAIPTPPTSFV